MKKESSIQIKRTFALNSINNIAGVLKKVGWNPFSLNAANIIHKAAKKAQYKGQIPSQLRVGMQQLVTSLNNEAELNSFGELAIKGLLERTLYGRFKVEQVLAKNPDIEKKEIRQPIFIIGMPRTGTSILHALMHEDPAHRAPLAWECLLPHPLPTAQNFADNPQLQTVQKEFEQLFKLVPDFQKKHYMAANAPQECLGVNMMDGVSFQTTAQSYIPSYMDWFNNKADQLETMRFHKRFLQYLQSGGVQPERWLLKSPVHLMRLNEIFEVYPDACVIMTHRNPSKVVPSASSLIASVRSLYSDYEDQKRTGNEQSTLWSSYFNRFLNARQKLDKEDQIIDLKFEDFVEDQLGTVQQIYKHFGWDLSPTAQQNMQTFLDKNPKDKHGTHHYTLGDFGLNETLIQQKFSTYINFLEKL